MRQTEINLLCITRKESEKRMRTNFIYFNKEIVMNRSENVSVLGKQFGSILKKPKLYQSKVFISFEIENLYSI